jgi:ABC-type dipeptide/oligopeptide/nickel transport system permease component
MGLRAYVARRLVYAVILLIAALSLNFIIFELMPGDLATQYLNVRGVNSDQLAILIRQWTHTWGLDQPLHIRYLIYLQHMFTWDFGKSMVSLSPVSDSILARIPWTLMLIGLATVFSIILGIVTGVISAYKRGSALDSGILISALMVGSVPVFWLGLVIIVIFAGGLKWFPAGGAFPTDWGIPGNFPLVGAVHNLIVPSSTGISTVFSVGSGALRWIEGIASHAFLPVFTLSIFLFGGHTLLARATMIDALTEDYIVTARAKGVSETSVLFRHALKNASLPIITAIALAFGFLFSGATITETTFSYPGLGLYIFNSVQLKDFFSMQAIFYIITLMVIIANIIADFLYGVIDPRIKYG